VGPAILARAASRLVRPVWGAIYLGQFSSKKIKFCHMISQLDHRYTSEVEYVITPPPERDKGPSRWGSCSLRRATHPPALYLRGEELPQAVPAPQTPHKPRRRRARRLSPHYLFQPATSQRTDHSRQSVRGRCGPHLRGRTPAAASERCATPREKRTS
jgi:hypothetical protein